MADEPNFIELLRQAIAKNEPSRPPEPFLTAARNEILKEPSKAAAVAYLWLTAVGFARIFGIGWAFGVNAIDFTSPSDFLLAGVRDPFVGLAAAVSGAALFWMSGKGATRRGWRLAVVPTALVLLALGAFCSKAYRYAVVAGSWSDASSAPRPSTVTVDHEHDGTLDTITCARLVLSTSDYLVFYRRHPDQTCADGQGPPEQATPPPTERTVIVPKESVKRIELTPR